MSVGKFSNKIPVTLWLDHETIEIIDNNRVKENLRSRGEVVINDIRLSKIFKQNLQAIKTNPEALEKAMIEIDELRKQEKFGLYFESLSSEQRHGLVEMIQLIDQGKWQQTRLV